MIGINHIAMGALLVFLNSLFFYAAQTQTVEYGKQLQLIQDIQRSATRTNYDLVRARLGMLPNYDSLGQELQHIMRTLHLMEQELSESWIKYPVPFTDLIHVLQKTLDDKLISIQDFMEANSIVLNSSNFMLHLGLEFIDEIGSATKSDSTGNLGLLSSLKSLRSLLSDYSLSTDIRFEKAIRREIGLLYGIEAQFDPRGQQQIRTVIHHVLTVLRYQSAADEYLDASLSVTLGEQSLQYEAMLKAVYQEHIGQAEYYRTALYIVSLLTALYLGFLFVRLAQSRQEALNATQRLELRVNERTIALRSAVATLEVEIEEREVIESSLRESEEQFQELFHRAPDMYFALDDGGNIVTVNDAVTVYTGLVKSDLIGADFVDFVYPEERALVVRQLSDVLDRDHDRGEAEFRLTRSDGTFLWVHQRFLSRSEHREKFDLLFICRDITDRKRTEEERLAEAKVQRDVLVREVHHRIKNNLQGVANLLEEQMQVDPRCQPIIQNAVAQVNSIASVHGLQGLRLEDGVHLGDLVLQIASGIQNLYENTIDYDGFEEKGQRIMLSEKESVPCALVLSEILTNAFKYNTDPEVKIRLRCASEDGFVFLSIFNRGDRLPVDFDFSVGSGLGTGLELVRSLLPPNGASLSFGKSAQDIVVELRFSAPVILIRE